MHKLHMQTTMCKYMLWYLNEYSIGMQTGCDSHYTFFFSNLTVTVANTSMTGVASFCTINTSAA